MSSLNIHKEEMIASSTPSIKLRLKCDYPSNKPKCVFIMELLCI